MYMAKDGYIKDARRMINYTTPVMFRWLEGRWI